MYRILCGCLCVLNRSFHNVLTLRKLYDGGVMNALVFYLLIDYVILIATDDM